MMAEMIDGIPVIQQQIIYLNENTVILDNNDVQYILPSGPLGSNELVVEGDGVLTHYLMDVNDFANIDDSVQTHFIMEQCGEEFQTQCETIIPQEYVEPPNIITNDVDMVAQVTLSEDECRLLQGYGQVVLHQGERKFLLNSDGLQELNVTQVVQNMEYRVECEEIIEEKDSALVDPLLLTNECSTIFFNGEQEPEEVVVGLDESSPLQVDETLENPPVYQVLEWQCNDIKVEQTKEVKNEYLSYSKQPINSSFLKENLPSTIMKVATTSQTKTKGSTSDSFKTNEKIYIGNLPDGKRLYGRIISIKQGSKSSKTKTNINPDKPVLCQESEPTEVPTIIMEDNDKPLKKEQLQTSRYSQGTEQVFGVLNEELNSINKVLVMLLQLPNLTDHLISRDLMIIKVVGEPGEQRESVLTGRMAQQNGSWEFIPTPELHDLGEEDDTIKTPDFLIVKLTVSYEAGQQATEVVVIDKAKTGLMENFNNEIDWSTEDTNISGTSRPQIHAEVPEKPKFRGDRKFDCFYCKKKFNRISNLSRHIAVHVESKSSFGAEGQDVDHGRSYACDLCPCAYYYASTLTRHMISAHMDCVSVVVT